MNKSLDQNLSTDVQHMLATDFSRSSIADPRGRDSKCFIFCSARKTSGIELRRRTRVQRRRAPLRATSHFSYGSNDSSLQHNSFSVRKSISRLCQNSRNFMILSVSIGTHGVAGIDGPFGPFVSFGAFIKSCFEGHLNEALQAVDNMLQKGISVSTEIFFELVQRCIEEEDLKAGRELCCLIARSGLEADIFLGRNLIRMFALFESLLEANQVFINLPKSTPLSWSAIISVHIQFGQNEQAFILYHQMKNLNVEPDTHVFVAVLKACAAATDLTRGKLIHAHILESGFEKDIFVGNTLVDMYAKCGSIQDACIIFHSLPKRDVITWNVLIAGYAQVGHGREALQVFQQMQQMGMRPDQVTFVCIIKICSGIMALEQGRMIHSHIIESGLEMDLAVSSVLIYMYGTCGSLDEACIAFNRLPKRDVSTWSKMIAGYTQHGQGEEALQLFQQMQEEGIEPDRITLVCTLKASSSMMALEQGKKIHYHVLKKGLEAAASVGSILIKMYCKCGSLNCARMVFNRLPMQDVATWSALMAGYIELGYCREAFQLFHQMQQDDIEPDQVTFVCLLKACSSMLALDHGHQIHAQIVESGYDLELIMGNTLIDMYSKCGILEDAHTMFHKLPTHDVVTWNVLISGCTQHGCGQDALFLFHQMQQKCMRPNVVTFACVLKACSSISDLEQGKQIHAHFDESELGLNIVISNALVDMYSKCGSLDNARLVFDGLPKRDVGTWNALFTAYVQHEHGEEAFQLFQQMQQEGLEPDQFTYVCILKVCSSMLYLDQGKFIHFHIVGRGLEMDVFVANTLIDMYGKCGSIEDAHKVFDRMQIRDVITWSALMTGYAQHGHGQETLQIFQKMQQQGMKPDQVAFVCVLKACSSISAWEGGKSLHAHVIDNGFESDLFIGTALIDMYGKCGSLEDAHAVFDRLPKQEVVIWNAILAGYAEHSEFILASQHFNDMKQAEVKPNGVTFVCLLSACSHAGLTEEGCHCFTAMREDHGIVPGIEHYDCMVDILGHGGYLNKAEDLLETIPHATNLVGWTSLLSSCRIHGDVDLGRRCFNHAVKLNPGNAAVYVLMSNIYAHAGMQHDAKKVEELRRCQNMWKKPAKAYIEIGNRVHKFVVGDKTHPQSDEIYAKMKALSIQSREQGYISHLDSILPSLCNEDKEDALCGHCEKLAIAFGLINTPLGTTIRVGKNLRMCTDCHIAAKIASQIERREIILADTYRIHHFKDGVCSCKDLS